MGGVNPAQLLINADFCEQDVLVQKRRQKEEIRIESQPCRKEEKRAEEMSTNSIMSCRMS